MATEKPEIHIVIDHKVYVAPKTPMTAEELRVLADPDIGTDRDLFLTVEGPGDDQLINDGQVVAVRPTMVFYSPRTINPGGKHGVT